MEIFPIEHTQRRYLVKHKAQLTKIIEFKKETQLVSANYI